MTQKTGKASGSSSKTLENARPDSKPRSIDYANLPPDFDPFRTTGAPLNPEGWEKPKPTEEDEDERYLNETARLHRIHVKERRRKERQGLTGHERNAAVDWSSVEREYRLGQLSLRDLAKAHGCHETAIRRRATKYGWTRDLKHRVQEAVKDTLIRGDAHGTAGRELVESDPDDDALMVQAAALRGAEVVRQHRLLLEKGRGIIDQLMSELVESSEYASSILAAAKAEVARGGKGTAKLLQYAEKAVSLHARAMSANQLSNAMKTMISEQRRAHNLDDDRDKEDAIDALLRSVRNSNVPGTSIRQKLEEEGTDVEQERWLSGASFAPQEELPH